MAKVITDNSYYTAIAGKIREKLGVQTQYRPSQMAAAIESIDTSGGGGGGGSSYEPWTKDWTEIDVVISETTLNPYCNFSLNGTAVIDWGDGSTDTVTGTSMGAGSDQYTQHTYAAPGAYTIKISGDPICLDGSTSTNAQFAQYGSLLFNAAGNNSNYNDASYRACVKAIRGGKNVVQLANGACRAFRSLRYASFLYVTNVGNRVFDGCTALEYVAMWKTSTANGSEVFSNCTNLRPGSIVYPADWNFGFIGAYFYSGCSGLTEFTVPDAVTTIKNYAFANIPDLQYIVFPPNLATIETKAFQYDPNAVFDFSRATKIPSIATDSFQSGTSYRFKVIVPASLYEDWIAATNWVSIADHIQAAA